MNVRAALLAARCGPEYSDHRDAVDRRSGEDGIADVQAPGWCGEVVVYVHDPAAELAGAGRHFQGVATFANYFVSVGFEETPRNISSNHI